MRHFNRVFLLVGILVLAGCGADGTFSGKGQIGGGGLVGGGGGGGGGPNVTVEPVMQYGPGQTPGFGNVKIAGNASKIVFVDDADPLGSNPNNEWQLFVFDILNQSVDQITDGSAGAIPAIDQFDLTDSGDSVVWASAEDFVGTNPNNQMNIFIGSTTGGGINRVTQIDNGSAGNPQISGTSDVVFLSGSDLTGDNPAGDIHIFSINVDGSGLAQVTTQQLNPENLAFADNGSKIAFEGSGDPFGTNADGSQEIFVIDIDGTNLTQITATDGDSLLPKISDNGSKIAFTTQAEIFAGTNADGNYEMYVAESDGSTIVRITDDAENAGTFTNGVPGGYDISGNGSYVVFGARGNLTGENPFSSTIFWATTDGSTIQQFLRQGTIPDEVYANENYDAENVSVTNAGDGVAFESTVNYTSSTVPDFVKIYTTVRQ